MMAALSRQCRLQCAQLLQAASELVALGIVLAVRDVFFDVPDIARQQLEIEILTCAGAIGEHSQSGGTHFGKAADDNDGLAVALAHDRYDAWS